MIWGRFFQSLALHCLARFLNLLGFKVRAFQLMVRSKEIADNLFKEIF